MAKFRSLPESSLTNHNINVRVSSSAWNFRPSWPPWLLAVYGSEDSWLCLANLGIAMSVFIGNRLKKSITRKTCSSELVNVQPGPASHRLLCRALVGSIRGRCMHPGKDTAPCFQAIMLADSHYKIDTIVSVYLIYLVRNLRGGSEP